MAKSDKKPLMITVAKAVDVLLGAIRTRRAVVSGPRTAVVAACLLSVLQRR